MTDKKDSMRDIMDQFRRIDAEMGGKNLVKDTIREDVVKYRSIVEGRLAHAIDDKAKRESREKWDSPYGFMRSLAESKFEVLSMDSDDFDMDEGNGEVVGTIEAMSVEAAQAELGAFADRLGLPIETLFIRGLEEAEIDPAMDIPGEDIVDEQLVDEAPKKPKPAPVRSSNFVKLTDYEQTDKLLSDPLVHAVHSSAEQYDIIAFYRSSDETGGGDPWSSTYDWQKAANAAMFGGPEEQGDCIGVWYTDAKYGSFNLDFKGDDRDYTESDPNYPWG